MIKTIVSAIIKKKITLKKDEILQKLCDPNNLSNTTLKRVLQIELLEHKIKLKDEELYDALIQFAFLQPVIMHFVHKEVVQNNYFFKLLFGFMYYAGVQKIITDLHYEKAKKHTDKASEMFTEYKYWKIYELLLTCYDKAGADVDGRVYTQDEVCNCIVQLTNSILKKDFNTSLCAQNVNIIEPMAGTGNFVVALLKSFSEEEVAENLNKIKGCEIDFLSYVLCILHAEHVHYIKTNTYKKYTGMFFGDTFADPKDNLKTTAQKRDSGAQATLF